MGIDDQIARLEAKKAALEAKKARKALEQQARDSLKRLNELVRGKDWARATIETETVHGLCTQLDVQADKTDED